MRYYPNYFDDFFNDTKKQDTNTVLRTDIYEKNGYYQICMEVCGIQKENIQIELKDGYLKITATRNIDKEDTRVLRQERFTGTYSRSFRSGRHTPTHPQRAGGKARWLDQPASSRIPCINWYAIHRRPWPAPKRHPPRGNRRNPDERNTYGYRARCRHS